MRVQRAAAGTTPSAPRPATHGAGGAVGTGGTSGFVDAGAVAVAAGLAHRAEDGSVVFGTGPPSPSPSAEWGSPPPDASVKSQATTQWPAAPGPTTARLFAVQRAAADSQASSGTSPRASALTSATAIPPAPPTRRVSVTAHAPAPTWASAVQREAEAGEASSATPSEPPSAATPDITTAPAAPADAGTTSTAAAATPPPAAAAAAGPAAMTDRDVDRLARRLYPRLRDHLRGELRLDRERLGRASDVGMRG